MQLTTPAPDFKLSRRDPRVDERLREFPPGLFNDKLYQSIELLERYSIDLAITILNDLGVFEQLCEWRSASEICQVLRFQPQFVPALGWLLQRIAATNCLEARNSGVPTYRLTKSPWMPELTRLRDMAMQIDPSNQPTLNLLDRAAGLYRIAAHAEHGIEEAFFGPDGIALWLAYFSNDNLSYSVNNWVTAILASKRASSLQKLRILELGAGGGSATEILLRQFRDGGLLDRIESYDFTEPNAFFRRRAQRDLTARWPKVPFRWSALDMNKPWNAQGINHGAIDLIVAVNVLHVAYDLSFAIMQAHDSLAAGSHLVIGECLRPQPGQPIYIELVFQLLDSFTNVVTNSEYRPNAGFLTAREWRDAFANGGFVKVEVVPDVEAIQPLYAHFFTGAVAGQRPD